MPNLTRMTSAYARPDVLIDSHASGGARAEAAVISHLQESKLFRDYQQAFEETLGLPLVLRAAGSFQTPLQGSKRVNAFCALMTQANKTCAACLQLQQRVEEAAALLPKTLQCYAGLSETAIPVRVGHKILGYLQTGQVFFRSPAKKQFNGIVPLIQGGKAGVDTRALESAYFRTRVIPGKQYGAIIRLLAIFAEHLSTVSNQMLLTGAAAEPPVITRGRKFIAEHQSEDLGLTEVARAMNMSAFHFCKVFKKTTGLTFTEYLARERVESVKERLLNVHVRVSEAAYAAGFQSLSQFNRVFRRIAGETPSRYRDQQHGSDGKSARIPVLVHAA